MTINIYVDTDATGVADGTSWTDAYTSLADAEAENLDLVTAAESCIIWCRASNGTADTAVVTIDGWTTSADYTLTIKPGPDDWHDGTLDTSIYRITATARISYVIQVYTPHVTIEGLQILPAYDGLSGTDYMDAIYARGASFPITVHRCLMQKQANPGNRTAFSTEANSSGAYYFVNNIAYDFGHGIMDDERYSAHVRSGAVYNNTVVNCATNGFRLRYNTGNAANFYVYNNISYGSGYNDYLYANLTNTGNNISSDTTSPDSAFRSITLTFADADNDDYRLASTDADAIDAGADLSADAIYAVLTDAAGTKRPRNKVFDIGAFEYDYGAIQIFVDTDATGAGTGRNWTDAYTSLATAEAENLDLTDYEESCIIWCRASSGTADTSNVAINGWTTSATYTLTVTTTEEDRHAGAWDATKYRLVGNEGTFGVLGMLVSNIIIDGLQVENTNTGADAAGIGYGAPIGNITIKNNIVRSTVTGTTGKGITLPDSSNTADNYIINNIVYGYPTGILGRGTSHYIYILNNTVYEASVYGIRGRDSYVVARNNAVFNTADDFYGTFESITNCASDDGDGTNAVILDSSNNYANEFADSSTYDFRLVSGSSCIDAGADLSVYLTTDIVGISRPQGNSFDIGAFEYVPQEESLGGNYIYIGTGVNKLKIRNGTTKVLF